MSKALANQSAVAGAPGVLVVRGPDGKEHTFLVTKPASTDLLLMKKWVLAQPLPGQDQARGLEAAELEGLKPEQQAILLREYARAKGTRREPTESEAVQIVFSPAGVTMQVWLAARRHQPGLTREAVGALVTEANYDQVLLDLDEACGADPEGDDPKAPGGTPSPPTS